MVSQRASTRMQDRINDPPTFGGPCPQTATDLRSLLTALRPLGDTRSLARHAADCPCCFENLSDLFLATAPDDSDPIHRLVDGLNLSLYRVAKSILADRSDAADAFVFDQAPGDVRIAAKEALDRLEALDEYSEERAGDTDGSTSLRRTLKKMVRGSDLNEATAEQLLRRSIAIGGRFGLDAANLLGFLLYRRGDLDAAELLFTTVIERPAFDAYERETQSHAMNNLTGVYLGRDDVKTAILWCERSLMLKERLALDARTNYVNLIFFWLEQQTAYGHERARHYLRQLLLLDGGKGYLEETLAQSDYESPVLAFRNSGLDKEFPEIELPPKPRQATLELKERRA